MGSDKVIVLCEDIAQEKLIRAWLKMLGYNTKREVRFLTDPSKSRDGRRNDNNGFVDTNYVEQVQAQRARVHRMQCALVICRDTDGKTASDYLILFNQRLIDDSSDERQPNESIALLFPSRNVETWLVKLADHDVDETNDYKALCQKIDVDKSAQRFGRVACHQEAQPADCPTSLQVAFDNECPRIPKR